MAMGGAVDGDAATVDIGNAKSDLAFVTVPGPAANATGSGADPVVDNHSVAELGCHGAATFRSSSNGSAALSSRPARGPPRGMYVGRA